MKIFRTFPCFRPRLPVAVAAFLAALQAAFAFDVVALVDSLDYAKNFDIETATGTVQVLEHVLLTHPTDIWWRDKGGGRMRYPSLCESWQVSEAPFDKRRLPSEDIYGWLRLESPRANAFPLVLGECSRRGLRFGIHTTLEENHWYSPLASNWTLAHPEYWSRTRNGEPWMGCCSIFHPDVVAHKLDMLDERLALKPEAIMLDFWRNGSWSFAREYAAPALAEWARLHPGEPAPPHTDPRWQAMVGERFANYLRAFSAKCRAAGVRFIVGLPGIDDKDDAALRARIGDFGWRTLAREGTFDAVYVLSVAMDPADPFGSTERIYRSVKDACGATEVYFPLAAYNMEKCGIVEYARRGGVSEAEAAKRLIDLARDCGGRGVVLECVDFENYKPEVRDVLAAAPAAPAPLRAKDAWAIEGFDAFRRGTFGNAGQNLYVSRAGVLQRIYRFDIDGDGTFDLPFANCQEHHESAPSYVYALDGTRLATLPGQGALSGSVADLDGDGTQDIVIAGHHDMVSPFAAADLYFGGSDGQYGERRHIRLQSPRALDCATGRFDATGRRAIVFAMPRWGFVRVYPQSEIGFEWARFTDIPAKCDALCAGDFDGDGFDDLACRDDATGSIAVFWGGEAGLDAARVSSTPSLPAGELLGPEQKAGLKSELEEECPPPRLMDAVLLGGRTCFTLSTGRKLIFFAAGKDRAFSRVLDLDAPMAMATATGDFNGDGHDDVAIAARARDADDPSRQTSWIWFGAADGFKVENRISVETRSACSVDAMGNMVLFGQCAWGGFFTNDALLFTFDASSSGRLVEPSLPSDAGRDASMMRPPRLPEPRRFAGEDMRRARLFRTPEGEIRIALVNHHARRSDGYDKVFIYTGGRDGYSPERKIEVPGWCAVDTVTADLDDDGFPEMIVCNDSENAFHLDPGHHIHHFGPKGFDPAKSTTIRTDIGWGAAVADFDRDGHLDILTVCDHWNALAFFKGGPDGFTRAKDIDVFPMDKARIRHNVAGSSLKRPDAGGLRWISVADLNGDGWLDVALPAIRPRSFVLWGGPEGFDFARRQEFATGPGASARVADLDGDGRPELIFGAHTMQASGDGDKPVRQPHHSYLHIYWNGDDGFSESRKCILRADAVTALCVGDFNADGQPDIFCGSYQGEVDRDINSFIYWNSGGSFSNTNRQDLVTHASSGCLAADFNEDGRIDLAVANHKVFGDHKGYSEVWWNGPEGFLPTRTTRLPTRGPHGMSAIEPGDILSRGPEEYWFSEPRRAGAAAVVDRVDVAADCPPKTWVKVAARVATSEEALASADWRDPAGLEVPQGGWLQIRLGLGATNALSSPRVKRVETHFQ